MRFAKKRNQRLILTATTLAALVSLCLFGVFMAAGHIQFSRNCEGYLKRAADANDLHAADAELTKAIEYLKSEGLDTDAGRNLGVHNGHTSIIYTTPDEDIGWWFNNIVSCRTEVRDSIKSGDAESQRLCLMKLRETLLDHGQSGSEHVTHPGGMAIYPHNLGVGVLGMMGFLLLCGAMVYSKTL